jgi:hypothetical protein
VGLQQEPLQRPETLRFIGGNVGDSEIQHEKLKELGWRQGWIQQNAGQDFTGGQLTYNRAQEGCFSGASIAGQNHETLSA